MTTKNFADQLASLYPKDNTTTSTITATNYPPSGIASPPHMSSITGAYSGVYAPPSMNTIFDYSTILKKLQEKRDKLGHIFYDTQNDKFVAFDRSLKELCSSNNFANLLEKIVNLI